MKLGEKLDNYLKSRYAFLFQGVGLEYQRFIHLLDEKQKELLHQYSNIVNNEIKLDLWNYLYNSSETKYDKMFNDWIAIYTIDNIVYRTYIDYGIKPELFLGYSMGLIIAMACGGSISFADGVHMLLKIYEYPREALRKDEAIAVVTGMTINDIDELIQKNSLRSYVEVASENSEYCIVISGKDDAVKKLKASAIDEGALMVKEINAPYAFHSSLAAGGIDKLIEFVSKLEVLNSDVPIISCYTQDIIFEAMDLKKELVKNMVSQMQWKTSIEKIAGSGINNFVEVSLGDMLTRFSRMINSDANFITYNRFIKSKSKIISSGAEDETFVS
jgi:malonyl CoA-acyl carrier protein transacylase